MKAAGSPAAATPHSAGLQIDGEYMGYYRSLTSKRGQADSLVKNCTFKGWRIDHLSKRAFKFGQPQSAFENGQQHHRPATESQVGTMVASVYKMESYACQAQKKRCSECDFKGFGKALRPQDAKQASSVIQVRYGDSFPPSAPVFLGQIVDQQIAVHIKIANLVRLSRLIVMTGGQAAIQLSP